MSRLPKPGSDDNVWGDLLNEFLSVEHNTDGSLKRGADITAAQQAANSAQSTAQAAYQKPGGGIPKTDLESGVQTSLTNADSSVTGIASLTTNLTAKTDKSTLTTKGDMYVATAANNPARFGVGADGGILTADSSQVSGLRWGTHAVGGGNYIANPSFGDTTTGWTVGSGCTLSSNTLNGLYEANCGSVSRTGGSGTGIVKIISPRSAISPSLAYSASASYRLGTLGTTTARSITLQINWYDAVDALISSQTSAAVNESIQGSWGTVSLPNAIAPDTAAKAEVEVNVASVPEGEAHYFDGFQLEPGTLPTSFNANFPQSSLTGAMLTPLTVTSRETAVGSAKPLYGTTINLPSAGTVGRLYWATDTNGLYFDNGTTWVLINASGSANLDGMYDFPFTYDPRLLAFTPSTSVLGFTANNVYYSRLQGAGTINGLMIHQLSAVAGDVGKVVNLALYTNTGSGRSSKPSTKVSGSDLVLTMGGSAADLSGNFSSPIATTHGWWVGFSTTASATSSFSRNITSNSSTSFADGLNWQTTTGGTGPSLPGTAPALSSYYVTLLVVGV